MWIWPKTDWPKKDSSEVPGVKRFPGEEVPRGKEVPEVEVPGEEVSRGEEVSGASRFQEERAVFRSEFFFFWREQFFWGANIFFGVWRFFRGE